MGLFWDTHIYLLTYLLQIYTGLLLLLLLLQLMTMTTTTTTTTMMMIIMMTGKQTLYTHNETGGHGL